MAEELDYRRLQWPARPVYDFDVAMVFAVRDPWSKTVAQAETSARVRATSTVAACAMMEVRLRRDRGPLRVLCGHATRCAP